VSYLDSTRAGQGPILASALGALVSNDGPPEVACLWVTASQFLGRFPDPSCQIGMHAAIDEDSGFGNPEGFRPTPIKEGDENPEPSRSDLQSPKQPRKMSGQASPKKPAGKKGGEGQASPKKVAGKAGGEGQASPKKPAGKAGGAGPSSPQKSAGKAGAAGPSSPKKPASSKTEAGSPSSAGSDLRGRRADAGAPASPSVFTAMNSPKLRRGKMRVRRVDPETAWERYVKFVLVVLAVVVFAVYLLFWQK